jgi:hypothetical protein
MRICGACLLGHSYEELDARIIRTIDEYTKAGSISFCRLGTKKKGKEKKVCTFSAGHRGRRWHGEVTGAYCIHHSTKFFSYKVFDFRDLDAGCSYWVIYTCTVFSVSYESTGIRKQNKNEVTASTIPYVCTVRPDPTD